MRMRRKKWARPELEACPYFVAEPWEKQGEWTGLFPKRQPVWIELGCGKGNFLAQYGIARPDRNFLGIDMISDMLGVARRRIQASYAKENRLVDNLLLTSWDITRLDMILNESDRAERIFINFCNPWNKPKQYKKRLTHPRQLALYRRFLADGGEIRFKTDDDILFEQSLSYFEEMGFSLEYISRDLHQSGFFPNYRTEHEEMYSAEGVKIKFAIVRKLPDSEVSLAFVTSHKTPPLKK